MSESRPHILYIAEFSTGGSIESLLTLLGGIDKDAFRLSVLFYTMPDDAIRERVESAGATVSALRPHSSAPADAPKQLPKYNLQKKVRKIFGRRIERAYASLKFALYFARIRRRIYKALRDKVTEIGPDLVHLNTGVATDTPGILAANAGDVPAVSHVRDFDRPTYLTVTAARAVKTFICISSAVRDNLIDSGISAERCIVVPNAVDLERFDASKPAATDIRSEFGWNASHKVFAHVGRVVSWKGQDFFIDAIAEARESNASIRGLIVGSVGNSSANDTYAEKLRSMISARDLENNVRFTGHRSDVPDLMRASDAVVCSSSLPEPFGRVIIESMAVGTPVIATEAGGTTDIIDNDVNGILVANKDSAALAQAILRLCNDENLKMRFREAGLLAVEGRYTVARHAKRITEIYQSILKPQAGSVSQ